MKELSAALVEAQKEMPHVDRDAVNPHFRSSYTTLDHLIAKTKPVLTKHGLTIIQNVDQSELGYTLRTIIVHESGQVFNAGSVPLIGADNMQKLGSALTYARRYGWSAALGIADEADDDGNRVSGSGGSVGAPSETKRAETPGGSGAKQRRDVTGTPSPVEPTNRAPSSAPEAEASGSASAHLFQFPSGKHAGKELHEVPADYLDWYIANGPRDDVKDAIRAFRGEPAQSELEDVPF